MGPREYYFIIWLILLSSFLIISFPSLVFFSLVCSLLFRLKTLVDMNVITKPPWPDTLSQAPPQATITGYLKPPDQVQLFFSSSPWIMASSQFVSASSLAWVVGRGSLKFGVRCGSLKFGVGLMSLWVSQVHRDSPKLGGVGWVLNRCGSWWVVLCWLWGRGSWWIGVNAFISYDRKIWLQTIQGHKLS